MKTEAAGRDFVSSKGREGHTAKHRVPIYKIRQQTPRRTESLLFVYQVKHDNTKSSQCYSVAETYNVYRRPLETFKCPVKVALMRRKSAEGDTIPTSNGSAASCFLVRERRRRKQCCRVHAIISTSQLAGRLRKLAVFNHEYE